MFDLDDLDDVTEKILRCLLVISYVMIFVGVIMSCYCFINAIFYDEASDPNRDYYIEKTDNSLQSGYIYDKIYIPATTETKTKTETGYGYGYVFDISSGSYKFGYGLTNNTVPYQVDVPEKYILKIKNDDETNLIYYINDIEVSEMVYEKFEIGDIYE